MSFGCLVSIIQLSLAVSVQSFLFRPVTSLFLSAVKCDLVNSCLEIIRFNLGAEIKLLVERNEINCCSSLLTETLLLLK